MDLLATVSQSRVEKDRGDSLDIALAVENYVTRHRQIVTRAGGVAELAVFELDHETSRPDSDDPSVFRNGSVFRVITEAWVRPPRVTQPAQAAAVTFRLPGWQVSVEPPTSA